ncbi:flagellar hook protein FlgK [Massilia sp. WF1]|uniref:flagellar hook-associated protein FlgK n=1 Tax=unclassified Massilia TaxID=2609279 RepID=UPI000649A6AC|nr:MULTISPECIES: flagellar hook-associated protein FlgK [unclassified Massilia]ALK98529.1 flagellar biosynthesis protein FlgK [Massilia sp. WG5]KLU37279.1 flagellar hook protein FlgK [Massilia sp. WF1]
MSLLSIGKSGLYAAQAALATTGNNITNANVAGYSRQAVVQETSISMGGSNGFIGTGTQIAQVKRYSDEFLNAQVRTAQASSSGLDAYAAQVSQIDNLLADTTSGLSPALQDFFSAVQNLTGDRAGVPSRGALLSSADTLAARFQSMNGRLEEIRQGVNTQVTSSVNLVNTYASQIAKLNDQIGKLSAGDSLNLPNDLVDKRDQLIMDLNKQVKATVMPGDNNMLTVSIGNGQPLVVGSNNFQLVAMNSPTDQTRITVGYETGGKLSPLPESALTGGALGGVLEFRTKSLDLAQNSLGRIALGLAQTFNDQHHLGLDANGNPGGDFFTVTPAEVTKNVNNNPTTDTKIVATVSDATKLTTSDYKVQYNGSNYQVIRLSDNQPYDITTNPQVIDGMSYSITGTKVAAGDNFLVRPTINGAAGLKLALSDVSQVAAGAPIATSIPLSNTGTAKISEGSVTQAYLASPLAAGAKIDIKIVSGNLTGLPAGQQVTMTVGGKDQPIPIGDPVPFQDGATYTVAGISFSMSGAPQEGDTFTIAHNTGVGDTRNASLLGDLQSKNILENGSATYQSAYAHVVSAIGNKTREVQVNSEASAAQLDQASKAAENVSGVNLDEEAANLLKYQQAYQAAGKVMQVADTIFNALLQIAQ